MKSEKLIAGIAITAVATLLLIPKTRRIMYDALCSITDSFKNIADDAKDVAAKGSDELTKFADKAKKDVAGVVNETRQAWQ
jgi:gas vesicle protein